MFRHFCNVFLKVARGRSIENVAREEDDCPAVETIGLSVFRRRLPVLYDINLVVERGETLAIMGPNGAGKSTLLKCLGGVMHLNKAEIRWFGTANVRSPLVRRRIGYVGHECRSYSEMTALENVTFAGRMYGVKQARDRATKWLRDSGLERAMHRPAGSLSLGMRRRLALACALIHEPALILLDEPFTSLDTEGQRWLERLFQHWRDEGRTICVVCHELSQIRLLADRILWLDRGRVAAVERSDSNSAAARRSA